MNLIRRASFLKNLSGGMSPTATDTAKLSDILVQDEALAHFDKGATGVLVEFPSNPTFTITGTIAARDTNATTGYTDIGSYQLDMGTSFGVFDQSQPVFHPGNANLARLYRATNGYLEIKLGFIYSGNPANFLTIYGTGGFVRYINRTRGIALTQLFLTETVGVAAGTIRFTKVGNLTQTGEAVGDVVRLEFYYFGG
jgi:hypothetical protein